MKFKFVFILCFFGLFAFAQYEQLDSLVLSLKNAKHDTVKCELLYQLGDLVPEEELEEYSDELEQCAKRLLSTKLNEKKSVKYRGYIATAYNNKALALQHNGDDYNALIYYKKSLEFSDSDEWLAQKASTLLNIGTVYFSRADYPKTIDYYLKSIKISEKIRDTVELANAWNNLALVYAQQNDRKKAIEIYTKALNLREAIHDMKGVANSYYNIATSHLAMKDFESSMEYFKKCYEIRLQLGNAHYIANTCGGHRDGTVRQRCTAAVMWRPHRGCATSTNQTENHPLLRSCFRPNRVARNFATRSCLMPVPVDDRSATNNSGNTRDCGYLDNKCNYIEYDIWIK